MGARPSLSLSLTVSATNHLCAPQPLSAHRHIDKEPYSRSLISPFGGYVNVPVPAPPQAKNMMRAQAQDPASVSRRTLNPAKAAAGHSMMHTREYGTGEPFSFRERVNGVVPGSAGHRPGARDVHHKMAFGGVPTFNDSSDPPVPGQGRQLRNRPTTSFQEYGKGWKVPHETLSTDRFRDAVGGVVAGYTGFVPNARTHFGSSHVGGVSDVGRRGHFAQKGHAAQHERMQGDKELDVSARTLRSSSPAVGYQGHLPRAMDAFGISYWKGEAPNPQQCQQQLSAADLPSSSDTVR